MNNLHNWILLGLGLICLSPLVILLIKLLRSGKNAFTLSSSWTQIGHTYDSGNDYWEDSGEWLDWDCSLTASETAYVIGSGFPSGGSTSSYTTVIGVGSTYINIRTMLSKGTFIPNDNFQWHASKSTRVLDGLPTGILIKLRKL